MVHSPTIDELLQRNTQSAKTHEPLPLLGEIGQLPPEKQVPMPKIFLVSCCDNRIDPWKIFGLSQWDAVVVRSCAGRIGPQMENLIFLDHVLEFNEVMILHHTDCSAELFSNDSVRQGLEALSPGLASEIKTMRLPGFRDSEQSIVDDVRVVRNSLLLRKELRDRARGFVFDVKTGIAKPIIV